MGKAFVLINVDQFTEFYLPFSLKCDPTIKASAIANFFRLAFVTPEPIITGNSVAFFKTKKYEVNYQEFERSGGTSLSSVT